MGKPVLGQQPSCGPIEIFVSPILLDFDPPDDCADRVWDVVKDHGIWGWCDTVVTAKFRQFEGDSSVIKKCSFNGEDGFTNSVEYPKMREEAIAKLKQNIEAAKTAIGKVHTIYGESTMSNIESKIEIEIVPLEEEISPRQAYDNEQFIASVNEMIQNHGIWGWCTIGVRAKFKGFKGESFLGTCSYKDADHFTQDNYYQDMKEEAIAELKQNIEAARASIAEWDALLNNGE